MLLPRGYTALWFLLLRSGVPMFKLRWVAVVACLGLLALPAAAEGFDLPARKAGCWQHSVVQGLFGKSPPDGSTYECVDAASEQARLQSGTAAIAGSCTRAPVSGHGASIAWDLTCTSGLLIAKTHVEVSGDFQSSYALTVISRTMQAGTPEQISKVVANAKWITAVCPVGLPPGSWLVFGGVGCAADGSGK